MINRICHDQPLANVHIGKKCGESFRCFQCSFSALLKFETKNYLNTNFLQFFTAFEGAITMIMKRKSSILFPRLVGWLSRATAIYRCRTVGSMHLKPEQILRKFYIFFISSCDLNWNSNVKTSKIQNSWNILQFFKLRAEKLTRHKPMFHRNRTSHLQYSSSIRFERSEKTNELKIYQ